MAEILSYCRIKGNSITVNDKTLFEDFSSLDQIEFPIAVYKSSGLSYPKFHKMDRQSKLGLLATELMLAGNESLIGDKTRTALVFANKAASIECDRNHLATIKDKAAYFPSPSIFVYTLANIVSGEIAIKYGITGENAFFVTEQFDPVQMANYTEILLSSTHTDTAICGWVNVDAGEQDIFVYCIKKSNFKKENKTFELPHSSDNLESLYRK